MKILTDHLTMTEYRTAGSQEASTCYFSTIVTSCVLHLINWIKESFRFSVGMGFNFH